MPRTVEVVEISGPERDRLLTLEESHFVELKAVEIAPAKLSRTISAFANASGGDAYIGLGESADFFGTKVRHWKGFKDSEAANAHLQTLEQLFPLGADYSYEFLRVAGSAGLVLHIAVQKTSQIARATDGIPYLRRGAQSLPVKDPDALERLRLDKGVESFERHTIDADLELVSESVTLRHFVEHVIPTSTPEKFLKKQALVREGNPVVAAVLLFTDEPQALLPKRSAVKLYRYKTSAAEGTRDTLAGTPTTIEGPIYDLVRDAVKHTVAMVEGIQKLGPHGLEAVKYPFETLHEIVTNAILHRDYSIAADVQIRVFDNRVEVESPGLLPGHITPRNILDEQFARNGTLVRLINKFPDPPNKDVGEGLNTAFRAMGKLRLKPPNIEQKDASVIVQIRHEPLASPEESVMDYLQNHGSITNRVARELTGITSENTMKEVFYRLRDTHLIERVPGRSAAAAAWRKKPKSSAEES